MTTISNWSQIGIWRYETVYRAYWPFFFWILNHAACVSSFVTNSPTATKLRKNMTRALIPMGRGWMPLQHFFLPKNSFFGYWVAKGKKIEKPTCYGMRNRDIWVPNSNGQFPPPPLLFAKLRLYSSQTLRFKFPTMVKTWREWKVENRLWRKPGETQTRTFGGIWGQQ
jgi:hypothetical protein